MDFSAQVKKMIADVFALEETEVAPDAHLQDDLGADSVAVMRLAEAIGTHYEIEILTEDLLELENVGELVELVGSKVSANQ
jgi:acyl carrier protein